MQRNNLYFHARKPWRGFFKPRAAVFGVAALFAALTLSAPGVALAAQKAAESLPISTPMAKPTHDNAPFEQTSYSPLRHSTAGPYSVEDSVRAMLWYHPNIKAFQEYRQAAEFDLARSRSGWLPRVDARASWGVERWNDHSARTNPPRYKDVWYDRSSASITVQEMIWDGLATLNRYKYSQARLASAADRLFDNSESLSLDTILTHIEIIRQRKMVALSELNVQNHLSILASQEERQRGGAASLADVTQTQGRLSRAQSSLVDSQQQLAAAMTKYKMLTDIDSPDLASPLPPKTTYPSLEAAIATCQVNNSKIKALQSDVDSVIAQKGIDKAAFHPQIYLEAGPEYSWRVQGSNTYYWGTSVVLRGVWNLYNGHYDWYNLKADKARVRQSKKELDVQKDTLTQEVTDTWNEFIAAREQTKFYTNAVEYNTQTRDMYQEQFNIGQRSLLDVLDAENELYNSSMLLVTSQLNQTASLYRLIALGGQLLEEFGIDKNILVIKTDYDDFTKKDKDSEGFNISF